MRRDKIYFFKLKNSYSTLISIAIFKIKKQHTTPTKNLSRPLKIYSLHLNNPTVSERKRLHFIEFSQDLFVSLREQFVIVLLCIHSFYIQHPIFPRYLSTLLDMIHRLYAFPELGQRVSDFSE